MNISNIDKYDKIYVIGKMGKSINFNPKRWGPIGGDNEGPTLFRSLAKNNPQHLFIMLGRNDLGRLKNIEEYDIPDNLKSVWSDYVKPKVPMDKLFAYIRDYAGQQLDKIKVDGGIFISGPASTTSGSLQKLYRRKDLQKGLKILCKPLQMFLNYEGPITQYLNAKKIPWIMIANDPRYLQVGLDTLNLPKTIISQYDTTVDMRTVKDFDEQPLIFTTTKVSYSGMEKTFLIGHDISNIKATSQRSRNFDIIMNEGNNGAPSRYPALKEYVLDYVKDVKIYGKWTHPEACITKIKDGVTGEVTIIPPKDARFKGSISFESMKEKIADVKYTFIVPISKGWVTAKVWESIASGVIPFLHKDYDNQRHVNIPDILRVEKPTDLYQRITYLNNNPDVADNVQKALLKMIRPEYLDGSEMSNTIIKTINSYID